LEVCKNINNIEGQKALENLEKGMKAGHPRPSPLPQSNPPIFFITNSPCAPSHTPTAPRATLMICVPASQEALKH